MPPNDVTDPKAEIQRLKAKMAAITDRDIRAALQARIDELTAKAEAEPPKPEAPEPEEEPPAPPTPEQIEKSERLVRQAMLEKQRGNKARVTELLQEAVEVAPGAPATLEALGDDFAERRRAKEAMTYYKRAIALDPKNVGLERKYAMLALGTGMAGSIEDQLRANLSGDSFLIGRNDNVASLGTARALSFFVPGLGHLILGRTVAGLCLMATWIVSLVFIIILRNDVQGLIRFASGQRGQIGMGIFVAGFVAIITLFIAVGSLGAERGSSRSKNQPPRPKPPVDLPFD